MPSNKQKNLILAVCASQSTLPTRDVVQKLKHREPTGFVSLRAIFVELGISPTEEQLAGASTCYARFREMDDAEFIEKHPTLNALWSEDKASPCFSGGTQGKSSLTKKITPPPTTKELLAKLNVLRQRAGDAALKSWKASRKELETQIARLEKKKPRPQKCPPAVADGAYDNPRQAPPALKNQRPKQGNNTNTLHLSVIAIELGITPKKARMKARKLGAKLSKLEEGKYRFPPAAKAQVVALLKGE